MSDAIRVVSLFSGIGGSDLGLYLAADELGVEVDVVAAIDSWEPAVRVYNANQRHPVARVTDVKQMTRADLPEHDLVIGGPPCQDHSLAGERKCKCHLGGFIAPRCCLADFLRLADGSPYVMENVVSRLIPAPYSVKLCAANFGDVTTRERWFYSNYLLHVIETPGPRRIRDIREAGADEKALWRRLKGQKNPAKDGEFLGSLTSGKGGVFGFLTMAPPELHKAGKHEHYDDGEMLGSLTAHSWHGHDIRNGKLLKIGMRGHSASASASAFEDDSFLVPWLQIPGTVMRLQKLDGCRNPTLLEMQRSHSFPDSWDWAGATKTQQGKMIANSWPVYMAKAVCKAILQALLYEREVAA